MFQIHWIEKAPNRMRAHESGGGNDQHTLQAAGEVFDLFVSVGVRRVHGSGGVPQSQQCRQCRQQIGGRLGGFRKQPDGTGERIGHPFEGQRHHGRQNRKQNRVFQTGGDHGRTDNLFKSSLA